MMTTFRVFFFKINIPQIINKNLWCLALLVSKNINI